MLTDDQNHQRWEQIFKSPPNEMFRMREEYLGLLDSFISWQERENISLTNKTGLNVGCGNGANTLFLADRGLDMTGVDYSEEAISIAHALAEKAGLSAKVRYEVRDLTRQLNLGNNSFDFVFDLYTLSSVKSAPSREAALNNMIEVLKPGGYLITIQFRDSFEAFAKEVEEHPGDEPGSAFFGGVGPQIKLFSEEELLSLYERELTKVFFNATPVYLFAIFQRNPLAQS